MVQARIVEPHSPRGSCATNGIGALGEVDAVLGTPLVAAAVCACAAE